jgi:hypothetical protein
VPGVAAAELGVGPIAAPMSVLWMVAAIELVANTGVASGLGVEGV